MRNRSREIREALGLTLDQAARKIGTSPQQLGRLELAKRRMSDHWAERIASAYGIDPIEIFGGTGNTPITVPVVGYIGAGAQVFNFDDRGSLDHVEVVPGAENATALIVRGDSMFPRYLPGDLIFYEQTDFVDEGRCVGRECVVQLADERSMGPTYIKRVLRGSSPGLYRLASYNAPDIEDVRIAWAARVEWIRRGDT